MPGWEPLNELVRREETQLVEEGADPTAAAETREEADRRLSAGADEFAVWAPFANVKRRDDYAFDEPSDLAGIRAKRKPAPKALPVFRPNDDVLMDKLHGAWLGRCAGCALGKPVEGFMGRHNGLLSWQRQKTYLTAISPDEWPLKDYFPQHSPAEEQTGRTWCGASTREQIAFMETDDDIRYTVLGQIIVDTYGRSFTSSHVAHEWFGRLTYRQVCTAETQAFRNMVIRCDQFRRISDPQHAAESDTATDWHFITHHLNPYREWIGAQIRIDSYAHAAAGNPELAAEFAWCDARISHTKNGIYGAMLCAAMIAAAFATDDPMQIVEAGLAQIPLTSRLYAELRQTIDICRRHDFAFERFEQVLEEIYALLDHYHPVHTNNNAALCVAAVLLSKGDFHKGITFAVMGGWDTDCNGATVGSIVGAITGAARAPAHWVARLNDTLRSSVIGYDPIAISECARRAVAVWKKVNA